MDHASKIVHLSTTSASAWDDNATKSDLIAVAEDGSVMCFQGEDLRKRWETSPEILRQDLAAAPKGSRLEVELVQGALASDVVAGFFGGKQDAFSAVLRTSQEDASTQDTLVLVSKTTAHGVSTRHLHILAILSSDSQSAGRLVQIHTSPIPSSSSTPSQLGSLRLDISTGSLMELQDEALVTYDLTKSMVKIESSLEVPDVKSFVRLSKSSVLAAKPDSLDVYNPVFRSLQASVAIDIESQSQVNGSGGSNFSLVTYFARLEIAVAVYGASLVAVQLEAPRSRGKKRRSEGLLIDSLGRGIPQYAPGKKLKTDPNESMSFSGSFSSLPGSVSNSYWSEFTAEVESADELLAANDLVGFEEFLARKFNVEIIQAEATNGAQNEMEADQEQPKLPQWTMPDTHGADRARIDRRWVLFAIARVFAWDDKSDPGAEGTRLVCKLPQSNVLSFLADAGHLTVSNFKSAFKDELRGVDDVDIILGEELPKLLVHVDPVFELLLSYLSSTKLGAVELLTAICLIMRSLELVKDPTKIAPKLLTFESQASDPVDPDDNAMLADQNAIGHELDRAVQELEAAEYFHLGDVSQVRVRSLSIALGKLGSCPRLSTIRVLRRSYKPEEILSLIYVLRMELVKDGWTTRYLDKTQLERDNELDAPSDGSITLLADLLSRCLDAVGPGGWLINDAIVAAGAGDHMDTTDFLAALKLEVSAALEGVQEAVLMRGVIAEALRYANNVQKIEAEKNQRKRGGVDGAALVLRAATPSHGGHEGAGAGEAAMLPIGLKAKGRVAAEKIVSGGEVTRRTKREVGHLVSQKVGPYSLERIII